MLRALSEFEIGGVHSLIPIHRAILEHPEFAAGGTMHEFVEGGGYAPFAGGREPSADDAAAGPVPAPERVADARDRGGRRSGSR